MGRRGSHLLSTGVPNLQSLDGEKGFVSLVVVGAQKGGIISGEARDFYEEDGGCNVSKS